MCLSSYKCIAAQCARTSAAQLAFLQASCGITKPAYRPTDCIVRLEYQLSITAVRYCVLLRAIISSCRVKA